MKCCKKLKKILKDFFDLSNVALGFKTTISMIITTIVWIIIVSLIVGILALFDVNYMNLPLVLVLIISIVSWIVLFGLLGVILKWFGIRG